MARTYRRSQRLREYLTFGLRVHYFLKVIIIQFATLFLTYQFAHPISVPIANGSVFQIGYSLVTVAFLVVVALLVRDMCLRSFNPAFHHRPHLFASLGGYIIVSVIIVMFGYMLLVVSSAGTSGLAGSDLVLGGFFAAVFSALLAVGYHERLESVGHPTQVEIAQTVQEWKESMAWTGLDDGTLEKERGLETFERYSEQLRELLTNAKTVRGKQLHSDFEEWWDTFQQHEPFGKEIVIKGQEHDEVKNEELQAEHDALMEIQSQLEVIAETNP